MNSIRSFSRYGKIVWAPAANVLEGITTFASQEVEGVTYVQVYSAAVQDYNFTLPESLIS